MNSRPNKKTQFSDLGLIEYQQAWNLQTEYFSRTVSLKAENRNFSDQEQKLTDNYLFFCEHPHVYTLGKSGDEKNLLIPKEKLHEINATFFPINRGGDITYHGPGQIVGYLVIDLENFFTDIHKYMRLLEESVIQTLADYKISAGRIPGLTGVWIGEGDEARKICALGVKTSRWVTMHGLAFNVNTNLDYFKHIVPCGIQDKEVTSMEKELGSKQDIDAIKRILKEKIREQFGMEWI
jgi:lipoyl(octanoyl) transferase